jgi:hypothetical protein
LADAELFARGLLTRGNAHDQVENIIHFVQPSLVVSGSTAEPSRRTSS